jgi:ribose transport system substrate-binding protein
MTKIQKVFVLVTLLCVLVVLSSLALAADKPYIPVICKGFEHQFWQSVKAGAQKAADEFGVTMTFEGPAAETEIDKQVEMLQTALNKKPAAICLAACDTKAMIPLLQKAQAAKIPIIGFDSGVDSDIPVTTCATDSVAAGKLAADKLAGLIGNEGKVAVIVHNLTASTAVDRRDGFVNEIKAKYPKIKIVSIQCGDGDHLKSADLTKAVVQANKDLKAIFATNEGSAEGADLALDELKMTGKIVLVGFDAGKQQLDAIRSGLETGAITQAPVDIGYQAMKAAVMAIKGEKLPKKIGTAFYWYDKTNIDSALVKPNLYN